MVGLLRLQVDLLQNKTDTGRLRKNILLICNQIVDHHGGSISVESSPGAGASFTVTLPVRYRGAERRSTATEESS
jgi:light-regulated signal transduction histidine kinase (bacteriophytochrome)